MLQGTARTCRRVRCEHVAKRHSSCALPTASAASAARIATARRCRVSAADTPPDAASSVATTMSTRLHDHEPAESEDTIADAPTTKTTAHAMVTAASVRRWRRERSSSAGMSRGIIRSSPVRCYAQPLPGTGPGPSVAMLWITPTSRRRRATPVARGSGVVHRSARASASRFVAPVGRALERRTLLRRPLRRRPLRAGACGAGVAGPRDSSRTTMWRSRDVSTIRGSGAGNVAMTLASACRCSTHVATRAGETVVQWQRSPNCIAPGCSSKVTMPQPFGSVISAAREVAVDSTKRAAQAASTARTCRPSSAAAWSGTAVRPRKRVSIQAATPAFQDTLRRVWLGATRQRVRS